MSPPTVTFCDCSGLNAILHASQQTTVTGGTLRLHYPPPMSALLVNLTDCAFLLLGRPFGHLSPPLGDAPVAFRPHRTGMFRWCLSSRAMCGDGPIQVGAVTEGWAMADA
ncbi:hypothetical protein [Streptomyces flaveus]|uniref:Uncharacterized protein n=1 Tax=Streptomyces flaveus TaxID=66370 RepID=A0A917RPX7_9ACTN|nr:hypothetical protein [Streptomyces flaveus]GGL17676.1 hypothetical protein GCM10010094_93190 [Streptomyces flaveus]